MKLGKIASIVGEGNFSTDPIDLICYSRDASENEGMPDIVVWPKSLDHVVAIVEECSREKIPITPRGAGTGLSGGAVPSEGGVLLVLSRMNKVIDVNEEDMYAEVEPGVVWASLDAELRKRGFFFPPDPASSDVCTMGGCVGENAGGIRGLKYGTTKDWILGLEVVLASGEVIETGSRTRKCVSGYDLTSLFVGSEGTLGIVTKIRARIHPLPEAKRTLLAYYGDLRKAGETVSKLVRTGIVPCAAEFLDRPTIEAVEAYTGVGFSECEALLLVEFDGSSKDVERGAREGEAICREMGALGVEVASGKEAEKLWVARKAALPALARLRPSCMLEDATVPVSKVPDMLERIRRIEQEEGISIPTFGHIGDGNLHPTILFDERIEEEREKAKRAAKKIFEAAIELGGTLSGEHGIGLSKKKFMPLEHKKAAIEAMLAVKKALDPQGIMNPGKIFPKGVP